MAYESPATDAARVMVADGRVSCEADSMRVRDIVNGPAPEHSDRTWWQGSTLGDAR